jgi:hypothetical protein
MGIGLDLRISHSGHGTVNRRLPNRDFADISDLLARPGAELASELSGKSLLYKQSTFGIGELMWNVLHRSLTGIDDSDQRPSEGVATVLRVHPPSVTVASPAGHASNEKYIEASGRETRG